jgi:hypothetical protein
MNITQIDNNLQTLVKSFNSATFIYDFLLAFGLPKASIKRLQAGGLNLSKVNGEIAWKKKLFFKEVESEELYTVIDAIKSTNTATKHDPRFIIVTDYKRLLAIDTKTQDSLDIEILEIAKHYDFFLPWAGMEKAQMQLENPADVKAAEKMAKLYDEIKKDNPTYTADDVHNLNVFLSRLLFCFFAEDTGIYPIKGQFTHGIESHTQTDGSDLHTYLDNLFIVLNTENKHRKGLPSYLEAFPYVNGGLFRGLHAVPVFTSKSRKALIDNGDLNWSAINPDIFGSMIQAVVTPEHRGGMGMHYTSVPNIMKVVEPLFLNELYEEFENSKNEPRKLQALLNRIAKIKIFDPACGSGNFLIISYKELRFLEIKILQQLQALQKAATGFEPHQLELIPKAQLTLAAQYQPSLFSVIELSNFYGIELDDFAHEIAILSLWLAQHQMNQKFKEVFGTANPTLPLQAGGNVVQGNACRLNWEAVCPKTINGGTELAEVYVLGNPPYLGARVQSEEQKNDMEFVFREIDGYNNLDFISAWFFCGKKFIGNTNSKFAFVTTNSICQGTQVPLLWPHLIDTETEIGFIHQSFKWKNNAKSNAAVSVMIIGLRSNSLKPKYIYNEKIKTEVKNINPFGIGGDTIYVHDRKSNLSRLPVMTYGSMPNDNGELILSEFEANELKTIFPNSSVLIKSFLGANELMNGIKNYCLWIEPNNLKVANEILAVRKRIENVKIYRSASKREATNRLSSFAYRFGEVRHQNTDSIVIPQTGSERREYLPIDFRNESTIISNAARVIYNAKSYLFAILTSKMHIVWVRAVAGRLKMDMQYSNTLCYNTFPFPDITETEKKELEKHTYRILEEREKHSEKTLAQLYDPDKMPKGLREAHHQLDLAVEQCYRSKPFDTDEERLEYLFKLYEQMIAEENTKGTLFEVEAKTKKKTKKK